jgi:hypothetical protein
MTNALLAVRPPWDHRPDSGLSQGLAEFVAVIGLVAQQLFDAGKQTDTCRRDRAVGYVAGREDQDPRATIFVNEPVNFAVPAAPGDANRLRLRPPFPPPAQRCALT